MDNKYYMVTDGKMYVHYCPYTKEYFDLPTMKGAVVFDYINAVRCASSKGMKISLVSNVKVTPAQESEESLFKKTHT